MQSKLPMSRCVFWIALFIILLMFGGVVEAGSLSSPVTVNFSNYYVDDAVSFMTGCTGISWVLSGNFNGTVTANFDHLTSSQILNQLGNQYNFTWRSKGNILTARATDQNSGIEARIAYDLQKIPLKEILKVIADDSGMKLSLHRKVSGEVTGKFDGTVREALDILASQYQFDWKISGKTIKISSHSVN